MFDPSGSSALDSFKFRDIWICEWTPNCGAVLRMNKNFVGRRFKWYGVNLDVSPKKAKCVVCLFRNAIYVRTPWKVWRDVDTKIFCWRYRFQYAIVKSILCRNWVFGPCYVNDLVFRGVKFHVPFITPAFKVVKIFLENLWLGRCWDGKIKSSVLFNTREKSS